MKYIKIVSDENKKRMIKEMCKENTLLKCKVLGYQEFLKKFYFDYDEKTIYYIAENYQVTSEIAEIYLNNLYLIKEIEEENEKIEFLKKLYQDLKRQNLLFENQLWKEQIKTTKIVFYHIAKQDLFFHQVIEELKKITKVEIINEDSKQNQQIELTEYEDPLQEVIGVIYKICDFIKKGIPTRKIYITNLNEEYRALLKEYSNIFHLSFELKEQENVLSNLIIHTFLKSKKRIEETIAELKKTYHSLEELEIIEHLIQICNRYAFIKDKKKKKNWIIEELKKGKKKIITDENSIKEISFLEEEIEEDSILFVMGVKEGNFPTIKKEEQYLKDYELSILNFETTTEQNELEKLCYQTKLKTYSKIFLSIPKKEGNIINQISSILKDIPTKKEKIEKWNHSHLYNQLMLASKMDSFHKYGIKDSFYDLLKSSYQNFSYLNYENKWKTFQFDSVKKISYSAVDTFYHCPFRYYLSYHLNIKKEENDFDLKIGNLCHEILKESYEKNFEFENSFQLHAQKLQITSPKEIFFLNKRKKDLKRVLKVLKMQEKEKNFNILTEEKITLTIDDMIFSGIVDKIYFKKEKDQTLISVIDYKTGNSEVSFDHLTHGLNLQLPFYLLLVSQLPYEKINIIGLYFQKIIPSIPICDRIHTEEELKEKKLMLQGYSTNEENILKIFDPTYENSKLIQNLKMGTKGFYAYSKILNDQEFKRIEEIAKDKLKEAIKEIKAKNFPIQPIKINQSLIGCEHCQYQEICYRKEEDIKNVKEVKQKEC